MSERTGPERSPLAWARLRATFGPLADELGAELASLSGVRAVWRIVRLAMLNCSKSLFREPSEARQRATAALSRPTSLRSSVRRKLAGSCRRCSAVQHTVRVRETRVNAGRRTVGELRKLTSTLRAACERALRSLVRRPYARLRACARASRR